MKKYPNVLSVMIVLVWVIVFILLAAEGLRHAGAQDIAPYVCRDSSYPTPRFEFHNLPTLPEGDGWGIFADGSTMIDGVWIMDALPDGTATLVTSLTDFTLHADDTTAPCDVPTPEPTSTPVVQAVSVQPVASVARMCVVKYPQLILVCS